MKGLPEELIYVLMIGAVLLVQYLMKRFGPQPEPPPIPQDEPDAELPAQAAPVAASVSIPTDTLFGRSRAPEASTALARRRFSRRSLMGNRRDVQNAIVIATILGPCRAYEPHEVR